jgi:transcriptional regulator with XRE-family HTH domain
MYKEIGKKMTEKNGNKAKSEELAAGEAPDFSKAIKQLRKESDLSLEKLSELSGINKQTLHSIENYSIKNPSFMNLEKIASALGLSLNDFILRARAEYEGNWFKMTAAQRWSVSFEAEKGFSIYSFSPPSSAKRDFFIGVMSIQGGKKLKNWKMTAPAKACIQPWDGNILFVYHGMNWRKENKVLANETLYYDAAIPHTFENLSQSLTRVLLVTYPSIF